MPGPRGGRPEKTAQDRRDRVVLVRNTAAELWRAREAQRIDRIATSISGWYSALGQMRADELGVTKTPSTEQLATLPVQPEKRSRGHETAPPTPQKRATKRAKSAKKGG